MPALRLRWKPCRGSRQRTGQDGSGGIRRPHARGGEASGRAGQAFGLGLSGWRGIGGDATRADAVTTERGLREGGLRHGPPGVRARSRRLRP